MSLLLDPGSIGSDLVEALADLGLRQTFDGQVDQAFLASVEVSQLLLEGGFHVQPTALLIGNGRSDELGQGFSEAIRQRHRGVVLNDVVLDQFAWQIWQITPAVLAVHANEVVVDATFAGGLGVDEFASATSPFAAVAVELLLEIVEVRSVPPGWG